MTNKLSSMTLKPIGIVSNGIKQRQKYDAYQEITSEIVVNDSLTEALDNLDEFSHIIVIYWMHQHPVEPPSTKAHPMGNREIPLKGVFATRSPHRPNPIGMSTARLLQRQDNVLTVEGLDAIDGTPVIDIKPHIPGADSKAGVRVPSWIP